MFLFNRNNKTDTCLYVLIWTILHWKYSIWLSYSNRCRFSAEISVLGYPVLKKEVFRICLMYTMSVATVASKSLNVFWPNSCQICIMGQNICTRSYFEIFRKSTTIFAKDPKNILTFFTNELFLRLLQYLNQK